MKNTAGALVATSATVLLAGCSSHPHTPVVATETATVTVMPTAVATAPVIPESVTSGQASPAPSGTPSDLRDLIEEAVDESNINLTPGMCQDWEERRTEILALMAEGIVSRLEPLRPNQPQEIIAVASDVIGMHIDDHCGAMTDASSDWTSIAAAAGLHDCNDPWSTTDHVGNQFTVTVCAAVDGQVVSLFEYDESQYEGMQREYTETTLVTPTWTVAASSRSLLDEVVGRLELAQW